MKQIKIKKVNLIKNIKYRKYQIKQKYKSST